MQMGKGSEDDFNNFQNELLVQIEQSKASTANDHGTVLKLSKGADKDNNLHQEGMKKVFLPLRNAKQRLVNQISHAEITKDQDELLAEHFSKQFVDTKPNSDQYAVLSLPQEFNLRGEGYESIADPLVPQYYSSKPSWPVDEAEDCEDESDGSQDEHQFSRKTTGVLDSELPIGRGASILQPMEQNDND